MVRRLAAVLLLALAAGAPAAAAAPQPPIRHVFTILLENKDYEQSFGANPASAYLGKELPKMGALVSNYYGTGHLSLDNYLTMISGQPPNPETQADCRLFRDVLPGVVGTDGIALGSGCVYPAGVKTIADQLEASHLTWGGFMEDMGKDPAREAATCAHPGQFEQDPTQSASATDQYATRHNPFAYFHSVTDDQASCGAHVVALDRLPAALASPATTPNYVFITPDLCHDGHDAPCADGTPGGYKGIEEFLATWVPQILASPAFKQDGLLFVTFDEAEDDNSACCNESTGPNTPSPGIQGPGGGKIGGVLVSPYIKAGTTIAEPINHYGYLRSVEDLFGVTHLGYAAANGLKTFQDTGIFTSEPSAVTPAATCPAATVGRRGRGAHVDVTAPSAIDVLRFGGTRLRATRVAHAVDARTFGWKGGRDGWYGIRVHGGGASVAFGVRVTKHRAAVLNRYAAGGCAGTLSTPAPVFRGALRLTSTRAGTLLVRRGKKLIARRTIRRGSVRVALRRPGIYTARIGSAYVSARRL